MLDWHVHAANPLAMPGAFASLREFMAESVGAGAPLRTPLELAAESAS